MSVHLQANTLQRPTIQGKDALLSGNRKEKDSYTSGAWSDSDMAGIQFGVLSSSLFIIRYTLNFDIE